MARKILDKPNVTGSDATYPNGNIKDRVSPTEPGTPGSVEVYGDFHQYFDRMMEKAGVTANGQPDNAVQGFQLMQALAGYVDRVDKKVIIEISQSGTSAPTATIRKNYSDVDGSSAVTVANTTRLGAGSYRIDLANFPAISLNPTDNWYILNGSARFNSAALTTNLVWCNLTFDSSTPNTDTGVSIYINTGNLTGGGFTAQDSKLDEHLFILKPLENWADQALTTF